MRAIGPLAILCALVPSCSSEVTGPTVPIELKNGVLSVTVNVAPFGIIVRNTRGEIVLQSYGKPAAAPDPTSFANLSVTHRSVEFGPRIIEGWDSQKPTYAPYVDMTRVTSAESTDTSATLHIARDLESGTVTIKLDKNEVDVDVALDGPWPHVIDDEAPDGPNFVSMAFQLPTDEHFFGLGERLVTVDHRGRKFDSWVEEGGIGQGEAASPGPQNPAPNGPQMTHKPIPFFLSTKGYGAFLESTFRTGTSFGAEIPDGSRIYVNDKKLALRIFVNDAPSASIADFTARTGRAHLPPEWAFGPRMRLDVNKLIAGVPQITALRQNGVPCTAADDATHFLPIGSQVGREAELTKWVTDLHALGYKALAYYNAYVSVTDARMTADVDEARKNGYFIKSKDGSELQAFMISAGGQTVATIDMTNPGAVLFYGKLLQRALDMGYDGWMLDFGEYLPPEAVMFDGRTGWEAHNAFPVLYQKATYDYVNKVRDDVVFFSRAGFTGTQATSTIHWSGDPAASFDDTKGLPAQVRGGVNAGLSGIPFYGSDVSGYTCQSDPPADKDVFLRWAAFGALSPIFEEENACSGLKSGPKWNVWSDAETTKIFGDMTRLHTRLFPYLYAAAKEATQTGMPIMRHPFLVHPTNANAYGVDLEYYFGPSLYVAPVVRRAATTRKLWLPPGRWIDFFTLDPLESGDVTRTVPYDTIPLFLKAGGIVPLLDPSIQTLSRTATDASVVTLEKVKNVLDVRVALDAQRTASIELVDGTQLSAALGAGTVTLPPEIPQAANEAELLTCSTCGMIETLSSGVRRVRITSSDTTATAGTLALSRPKGSVKVRWDVAILP